MKKKPPRTAIGMAFLAVIMLANTAQGQDEPKAPRQYLFYSFSYTPVYQFETSLDDGGSFDVSRHYFGLGIMKPFSPKLRIGLGLKYDYERWDFDGLVAVAGASPWSEIHSPGASLPIFYTFSEDWTFGFIPAFQYSGESGAELDHSLTYGGVFSLAHPSSSSLKLGLGFGVFEQLEKTAFFPFLIIDWKISERFRLTNPFEAGPAGPAGLEAVYAPTEKWELGLGGAYRSYAFRLDDQSVVPSGVGRNEFLVAFMRVQRKLGAGLALDLAGGALFDGKLTVEDSDGDKVKSDRYDPAPIVALTVSARF